MEFVHLQIHSSFSLMESTIELESLVSEAKQSGMHSLALTDHEVLFGAYRFYELCSQYDVKPIIGMTADVYMESEYRPLRFILLAKNIRGYEELVQLSNRKMAKKEPIRLDDLSECTNIFVYYPFTIPLSRTWYIWKMIKRSKISSNRLMRS